MTEFLALLALVFGLALGYGAAYLRHRYPRHEHFWEITGAHWLGEHRKGADGQMRYYNPVTTVNERCAGCGNVKQWTIDGQWKKEDLVS